MWPTTGQAEKFSKDALDGELFSTTPTLNYLSSQSGKRKSDQTILHKSFRGGSLTAFGANAPGELRRAKGSFLAADEIDAIVSKEGEADEGDILKVFWARGSEYPDTINVSASYPSVMGKSRVGAKMEASDGNQWFSTCIKCGGEPFVMHRRMLRYEDGKPQEARFECPKCSAMLDDDDRYQMAHGQGFDNWKPSREFSGVRGFQAGSMLWPHAVDRVKYPGGYLQMLAQQEIDAKASSNPRKSLRVIVNTCDAENWDPTEESEIPPDWRNLFDAREDYGLIVPAKGLFLTAFCDVQLNRIEVGWRAWGRDEESWGMDHVVIDGHVRDSEVWKSLRTELARKWKHESGAEMRLGMAFVDGGHYAEYVYSFMQELARKPMEGVTGHCRASKGIGQHGHPIIDRKFKTVAKMLKGYHLGTWEAKDRIYARLKVVEGEGKMHFNRQYKEEYFQQLTVERVTITYEGGQEIRKYVNEHNDRNEGIDIEVGNIAAWRLHPRNYETLEVRMEEAAQFAKQEAKTKAPAKPIARPNQILSGLNAW